MFATILFAGLLLQATPAPSPQSTATAPPSPAPSATAASTAPATKTPAPKRAAKSYKKIPPGQLSKPEVRYALTHQLQMARKLQSMHTIKFSNLRIYKLSTSDLQLLHAQASMLAYAPFTAQDTVAATGLLGSFLNIIANVNVSDALNGSLNGNTVNASLNNVLNGNNIAIGQVVGVYVNGGGIITTLIK